MVEIPNLEYNHWLGHIGPLLIQNDVHRDSIEKPSE
jgi:hypothetical protein